MKNAIKKAIEGGWKIPHVEEQDEAPAAIRFYVKNPHKILLDHLFWQALGKAMGWGLEEDENKRWMDWKTHWHDFIQHLIEGKSADSFFDDLLN